MTNAPSDSTVAATALVSGFRRWYGARRGRREARQEGARRPASAGAAATASRTSMG